MKIIKYMEWNLHAMGGMANYSLPMFVPDYIIKCEPSPDIVVLVEFQAGSSWQYFRKVMETRYILTISPYLIGCNQVCIALKKDVFSMGDIRSVKTLDLLNDKLPEFLQMDIKFENEVISIIGTRIKTEGNNREKWYRQFQFDFLRQHLSSLNNAICLGDYNMTNSYLQKQMENAANVFGPRTIDSRNWSYVMPTGEKWGLDLLVTKGKAAAIKSTYDIIFKTNTYARYRWDFVSETNGYQGLTVSDRLSALKGLPDHGVLVGEVQIV